MMKESPHEPLTAEQDKRDTIHSAMWASVVVFGMLALLFHGLAFLSWTEPTMEEYYAQRRMDSNVKVMDSSVKVMQNQIEGLYQWRNGMMFEYGKNKNEYEKHKHQFWTGKIKKEVIK